MPGPKRRKLGSAGQPVLSAFAARQRLRSGKGEGADAGFDEDGPKGSSDAGELPNPRRTAQLDLGNPYQERAVSTPIEPPGAYAPCEATTSTPTSNIGEPSQITDPSRLPSTKSNGSSMGRAPTSFSSFKPNERNYSKGEDGKLVLRLSGGERLVILGSYGIRVDRGEISLAGATLRPADGVSSVHSPQCHALPVLRTAGEAVVELQNHPSAANLRRLGLLAPVFGKLWNDSEPDGLKSGAAPDDIDTFQIIYTSSDGPKRAVMQELVVPPDWNKMIASLIPGKQRGPPVVVVTGPKSSGKSTFARILTNRLVTDQDGGNKRTWRGAAVLDLDPGQPEYSPPGILSLTHMIEPNLSPPFCHPAPGKSRNKLLRWHALAATTPAQDPEHYIECALDLVSEYLRTLRGKCPLVVNTPGWVQGTGLDLLSELIRRIRPTQTLYMSEGGPDETVHVLTNACQGQSFSVLSSQSSEYTSRTALHLRTMQAMSYFHLDATPANIEHLRWDPRPLTESRPWLIRYVGHNRGVLGIMFYDYFPAPDLIAEAVNGTILALVRLEDPAAFRNPALRGSSGEPFPDAGEEVATEDGSPQDNREESFAALERDLVERTPCGLPFIHRSDGGTLDPRHSKMVGLVLVRGVDTRRGELQVLTPIPETELKGIQTSHLSYVLVAGNFDTPTWAFTEDLYMLSLGSTPRDDDADGAVEVTDEDTDEDTSTARQTRSALENRERTDNPWVEMLQGNQKRAVGSRVWRVRRDLGRAGSAA